MVSRSVCEGPQKIPESVPELILDPTVKNLNSLGLSPPWGSLYSCILYFLSKMIF